MLYIYLNSYKKPHFLQTPLLISSLHGVVTFYEKKISSSLKNCKLKVLLIFIWTDSDAVQNILVFENRASLQPCLLHVIH